MEKNENKKKIQFQIILLYNIKIRLINTTKWNGNGNNNNQQTNDLNQIQEAKYVTLKTNNLTNKINILNKNTFLFKRNQVRGQICIRAQYDGCAYADAITRLNGC